MVLLAALLFAPFISGAEITTTAGLQITPDRTADGGIYLQKSRLAPSAGIEYRGWFTLHQALEIDLDYGNTNTRLANFVQNTWTMNRVSVDGAYEYRWKARKAVPFVKVGVGSLITLSGHAPAPGNQLVGVDGRLEELAGVGVSYKVLQRINFLAEYDCHLFRNPDFGDHTWHPQRNEVSEPRLGITYTFGR